MSDNGSLVWLVRKSKPKHSVKDQIIQVQNQLIN